MSNLELVEQGGYKELIRDDGTRVLELSPKLSPPSVGPPLDLTEKLVTYHNAQYPFPIWDRKLRDIHYLTRHHGVSWDVEWWHRYHTQTKSWSRVGYHFAIAIYQGGLRLCQMNKLSTVSWHDSSNYKTVGISFGGWMEEGHDPGRPTGPQLELWGRLMAWLDVTNKTKWPNLKGIPGHHYFGRTACPGDEEIWAQDLIDVALDFGQNIEPLMIIGKPTGIRSFALPLMSRGQEVDEIEHMQLLELENDS